MNTRSRTSAPRQRGTEAMNHVRRTEIERALLKRCPLCGAYVQGRAQTFHRARIWWR